MVSLEKILVLVVLIYGVISLLLIEKYKNRISELENEKKK